MKLPYWLLRLLPMWDYVCPKCKREVKQKSHKCPYCNENYGVPLRVPPRVLKDPEALEQYVHRQVFPKVSASQRAYLTQFFTEIFSDGFETGNYNNWTGTTIGAGNTLEVSSTYAHTGTYSSKAILAENVGGYAYAYKTLATVGNTAYMRLYFYLDAFALATAGRAFWFMWMKGHATTDTGYNYATLKIYGSTQALQLYYRTTAGYQTDTSATTISLDTWYCLEIKAVVESADAGEVRVYLNGTEVADLAQTGLNNAVGWGGIKGVWAGGSLSHVEVGTSCTFYEDCVVVADAYIGPEVEGGQPYVSRVQQIAGMQTFNPIHALVRNPIKGRKII
jgi:hypothetical protein